MDHRTMFLPLLAALAAAPLPEPVRSNDMSGDARASDASPCAAAHRQ